ncbi:hsp70 family protein, partial [Vibrio parahaemolyticus V-223/04]
LRLVKRVVAHN